MSRILLTGGAGYVGSHTGIELLDAGHEIVIFDNFSNSHPEVVERMREIVRKPAHISVIKGDIRNRQEVTTAINDSDCQAVIHLACLKAVGESVQHPLEYHENNVNGTLNVLSAMRATGSKILLFSSSATVYGEPQSLPLTESHPLSATNPYARSKLFVEEILRDLYRADPEWRIGILRYFNPVGAHESGLIGEDPRDTPNNLMPRIAQVAVGYLEKLQIWGTDYPTTDGTCVRDYLHVVDLAHAHLLALQHLDRPQCFALNLGTGTGHSVVELVRAFEKSSGKSIPCEPAARRPGDVASCYTDPSLAAKLLGWRAERGIDTMCEDTWRWQQQNTHGHCS